MMTNADPFVIRRARKDDIPALEIFYRLHFPDKPRLHDMALWHWEFIENPLVVGEPSFFLIESAGEIQGAIGYLPLQLRIGEQMLRGGHPVNYFVTPQFKGLPALRLLKAVLNECPIVIASYISDDAKRLFQKMGFVDLSRHVRGYYLPLQANSTRLTTKTQKFFLKLLYRLRVAWSGLITFCYDRFGTAGVRHEMGADLREEFESFVTISPERTLSVYKDKTYLQWRYARSPSLHCRFIHQYRHNRPTGLAVVHIDPVQRKAILLDIMVHPFQLSRSIQLLAMVTHYCRDNLVSLIVTDVLNGQFDKALRLYGFGSVPSPIGLNAYASDKTLLALLSDYRKWHFVVGDTDIY